MVAVIPSLPGLTTEVLSLPVILTRKLDQHGPTIIKLILPTGRVVTRIVLPIFGPALIGVVLLIDQVEAGVAALLTGLLALAGVVVHPTDQVVAEAAVIPPGQEVQARVEAVVPGREVLVGNSSQFHRSVHLTYYW